MSRATASTLTVRQARHIGGEIVVPGDKSLSHRAVLFAALADGTTAIDGFLPGEDCVCTMRALQAMGCTIEAESKTRLVVHGTGGKLMAPLEPLDCGNSGTAMRLMAGVLAAQPFKSRLIGDASLSSRPMKRIVDPLRKMGAKITGRGEKLTAPLEIEGGALKGIAYTLPVASAQLKSCLILAGLFARGTTSVTEKTPSRDHTERLLAHFHAPPVIDVEGTAKTVRVRGGTKLHARDFAVPGDFSSAAFWIVAAAALPDADLTITNLGMNGTRTGLLSVLLRMGAHMRESISSADCEPAGTLRVFGRRLRGAGAVRAGRDGDRGRGVHRDFLPDVPGGHGEGGDVPRIGTGLAAGRAVRQAKRENVKQMKQMKQMKMGSETH
jgi:3-phosphoshikimate 1-carboxyvinyltransferase